MTDRPAHGPTGQRRWIALAAVLALAAAICLVMWGAGSNPGPTAVPVPVPSSPRVEPPAVASPAVAPPGPSARPVSLTIPAIDVRTRLIHLGQHDDGTVEVPGNPALAGWFDLGPPPGAAGSSVILGHVDSQSGPAVFYRLSELQPGDRILVRLDDDTTVLLRVHSIRTYLNADFPAQKVYGRQGRSQLNLVTCGGAYDSSRGGYQSNVVVNARLA